MTQPMHWGNLPADSEREPWPPFRAVLPALPTRYLYFRMSGGEYCDDVFGCLELDSAFRELVAQGYGAVAACGRILNNKPGRTWLGEVEDYTFFRLLTYTGLAAIGYDEVGETLVKTELLVSDKAPPEDGSTIDGDFYASGEGEKISFDYNGVAFKCYVKHQDHEYWAGRFSWEMLSSHMDGLGPLVGVQ